MYPDYMGQKTLVPGIMEKCEMDEDGLRAVYHLRKGVISPWGNEFTADDVLWRIERGKATQAINNFLEFLLSMPGQTIDPPESGGYAKIDDYTVELTSSRPMPLACKGLTNYYNAWLDSTEIMKNATEEDPWGDKWVATNGGGFGGYRVTEWTAGKRVVMEANENYWRGAPEIKRIIYLVVPESANRVALLKQSKVHMAEGLSPDEIVALADDANARGVAVRGNQSMWIMINNTLPPYDNVKVRQAMNHLINQEAIIRDIYHGMMNRWQGVMPSTYPGYEQHLKYDFNPGEGEGAPRRGRIPRRLRRRALLRRGRGGDGIDRRPVAERLQEGRHQPLAEEAADRCELGQRDGQAGLARAVDGYAHSARRQLRVEAGVADQRSRQLPQLFRPKGRQVLQDGQGVVDPEARIAAHAGIQEHIHDLAPLGWIGEHYFAVGLSRKVSNFRWYTTQYYHVAEMSIAD